MNIKSLIPSTQTTLCLAASLFLAGLGCHTGQAANYQIIGWNEMGVDRLDSDYSVFSLWPPGDTLRAQFIYQGKRLTNTNGITVTYQAVADPDGSINSTSQGKSEFWLYALPLFGTNLAVDMGLNGYGMPGMTNRPMTFNPTNGLFSAEGIPITPLDDALRQNPFPMMRVIARSNNVALATNDVVLAISDEVNCRVCHASGTDAAAQPTNGWAWNGNPEHDYRLNILRRHDELRNPLTYPGILSSNGYNPAGLYRTVVADGIPILCVRCHQSTVQPGSGFGNIAPLTRAMHSQHASVIDPATGLTLNNSTDRSSCFQCHPGATTHVMRGAMGDAVAANGLRAIQCQSCHGSMASVGATNRVGWIDLPDCQSCHVGNASSAGSNPLRYTNSFVNYAAGVVRQPLDATFATSTNLAFGNYSLYRSSTNHGKLYCSACHGSSHAEFPANRNDNLRVLQSQGHIGMISECSACHDQSPPSADGDSGPHGMHEANDAWISGGHKNSNADCNACHGIDERGTELSEAKDARSLDAGNYGVKTFWRGYRIGCYTCHNGAGSPGSATPWKAATAASVSTNTTSGARLIIPLSVRDANTTVQAVTARVISQPANGTVGMTNWNTTNWAAIYHADQGFVGTNKFTFAAWNSRVDSLLYTGTVSVAQGPFSISANALVPLSYPAQWSAPFSILPTPSNVVGTVTFDWDFGDASPHSTNQYATHAYALAGNYPWSVISRLLTNGVTARTTTNSGTIVVGPPVTLLASGAGNSVVLSWPKTTADALLEQSSLVGSGASWTVCTNAVVSGSSTNSVTVPNTGAMKFYRLRKL